MVQIRPFKGIRPKQELSKDVASPPYDVLSTKEVEAIVAKQPQSFLRIIRPEVNHNGDAENVDLYQSAKEQFESYQPVICVSHSCMLYMTYPLYSEC